MLQDLRYKCIRQLFDKVMVIQTSIWQSLLSFTFYIYPDLQTIFSISPALPTAEQIIMLGNEQLICQIEKFLFWLSVNLQLNAFAEIVNNTGSPLEFIPGLIRGGNDMYLEKQNMRHNFIFSMIN